LKTAIIIADGIKQIMFTPENPSEKLALSMITVDDNISIEIKTGTFYSHTPKCAQGYTVQKCQGEIDYVVNKGDRYAQILVLPRPSFKIEELDEHGFEHLAVKQLRGDKGFGSSNK